MIRVSEPLFAGNEKLYLSQAIDRGEVSSSGSFVRRFEEAFAEWSGNKYAVAISSGTAALETAVWSLGIKEISIPAGTIISCFTACLRLGVQVHLHDNEEVLAENLMRCHLFGNFDGSTGIKIIDDLSQYWKPYKVQNVGVYSLYANKLITSGEGGVLVTNDKNIYDKAVSYRNLCHSKERFVHEEIGYNFRMSNLQGAVALAQLEQIDHFTSIKQINGALYLKSLPLDVRPLFMTDVPWMYLVSTDKNAGDVVRLMGDLGIECRRFFYPLHRQPCINRPEFFPKADELWNHAFYLPSGLTLTEKDIERVSTALRQVLQSL